jgi:asparagine synthase (glutamine-hydrolysing)
MCGIAGILGPGASRPSTIEAMTAALIHRGPDDVGIWSDEEANLVFGHRRLAVVDLSPQGHQPMVSSDRRWVLTFNGEIYNHFSMRERLDLEGRTPPGGWRGHSDTESLVEAVAAWGIEAALRDCVGMFAFGLWDRNDRRLVLARDRFGEKPLYYGRVGRDFVFASELTAFRHHPNFSSEIDRDALATYAALTVVPAPMSIYSGVAKLLPGCFITVDARDAEPRTHQYWSYRDVVLSGLANFIRDEHEAIHELETALRAAIAGQSIADVPVGAFLSGGIDSSTIVSLYQAVSGRPVQTYTIGFAEAGYDESADAKRVAEHLGTVHHQYHVGVEEARDVITQLPSIYGEPFADSSQIPTFLVSKFARADVKVAISGDGGDELFAGYNRHRVAPPLWRRLSAMPGPARRLMGVGAARLPSGIWNFLTQIAGERRPGLGLKAAKVASIMANASSFDDVYDSFLDEWYGIGSPVLGGRVISRTSHLPSDVPDVVRMTHADATGYLPDDILVKVDRAAMAVSLETRVPFLDHRVAAVAARIDPSLKLRDGMGKWVLRKVLSKYVPNRLVDRPKAGFAIPIGDWLKGPLRPWAEDLLDPSVISREGWFDPSIVQKRWSMHLSGQRDSTSALWAILMFQAWRLEQGA